MTTQPRKLTPWIARTSAAAAATVIAVLVLAALATPKTARADAASEAAGATLYQAQCVGCHGADGSGGTPIGKSLKVQDLRKPEIQAMKGADLAAAIEKGKGKMPPFKGKLNAAQIGQLVDYIRSLAKAK
jgi:mono/diheme cytochrome c family protein